MTAVCMCRWLRKMMGLTLDEEWRRHIGHEPSLGPVVFNNCCPRKEFADPTYSATQALPTATRSSAAPSVSPGSKPPRLGSARPWVGQINR
jgi:hypothetical protein